MTTDELKALRRRVRDEYCRAVREGMCIGDGMIVSLADVDQILAELTRLEEVCQALVAWGKAIESGHSGLEQWERGPVSRLARQLAAEDAKPEPTR